MAADSANNQELALKKRARRRLVGAIALVLLMVIVLPMILQDRASLAPQEAIKISMPDDAVNEQKSEVKPPEHQAIADATVDSVPTNSDSPVVSEIEKPAQVENVIEDTAVSKKAEVKEEIKKPEKPAVSKVAEAAVAEKKVVEVKKPEITSAEAKQVETKLVDAKTPSAGGDSFTIQVGVFTELSNVKQLQSRLKQIGFDSHTENVTTPKGEKIRLRAGHFNSRQEAAYALTKLQAADLTGMVISNK